MGNRARAVGQKVGGATGGGTAVPLSVRELDPNATQCRLGQGLPPCQVTSWSIQLFGRNIPTLQDRQTDNGPIALGQTVLQMVAQKQQECKQRNVPCWSLLTVKIFPASSSFVCMALTAVELSSLQSNSYHPDT